MMCSCVCVAAFYTSYFVTIIDFDIILTPYCQLCTKHPVNIHDAAMLLGRNKYV